MQPSWMKRDIINCHKNSFQDRKRELLLLMIWTVEAIVKSLVSVSLSCTETIFFFVRYMHTLLKRKILKCEKDW